MVAIRSGENGVLPRLDLDRGGAVVRDQFQLVSCIASVRLFTGSILSFTKD